MIHEVYTIKEVAEKLKVGRATVDRLIKAGKIRAINVSASEKSNKYRITGDEIDRFVSDQMGEPPKPKRMTRRNRRPKAKQFFS